MRRVACPGLLAPIPPNRRFYGPYGLSIGGAGVLISSLTTGPQWRFSRCVLTLAILSSTTRHKIENATNGGTYTLYCTNCTLYNTLSSVQFVHYTIVRILPIYSILPILLHCVCVHSQALSRYPIESRWRGHTDDAIRPPYIHADILSRPVWPMLLIYGGVL